MQQLNNTLKNNVYYSDKEGPPSFFHPDTNPILGHVLFHSADQTHVLVVTVELIYLFLNILFFNFVSTLNKSVRFTKFRRSCVKRSAVFLTNHCQSYTAFCGTTLSPNLHLGEEETLECLPVLYY